MAILAFSTGELWSALVGFFVIIGSLAGMRQGWILLRIGNAPRREDQVCPSCGKAAPVGNFWKCERCSTLLDVFVAGSVCPKCGDRMGNIQCIECGQRHALYDWSPTTGLGEVEEPRSVARLAESVGASDASALAGTEPSGNAARHYRKALTLLPRLSGAEMKILQDVLASPLNGMTSDLIERGEPALQELHQGATREFCHWELDSPKQLDDMIQLMVPVRRTCDLALLRARWAFREHEGRAALEDLADLLVLARHYGRIGLPLTRLMQSTVELFTTEIAAAHLLEQDAAEVQAFAARLANLPEVGSLAEMMDKEKLYLLHVIRPQFEGKNNEEALALLGRGISASDADAIWKAAGYQTAGLLNLIDASAYLYDEVGSILMLPDNRVQAALAEFVKQHQSTNPWVVGVVRYLLPVLFPVARGRVRLEMLQAAVAIAATGNWHEAARDPSRTGPFECRCFKTGFELKATSGFRDQPPITLFVGKRGRLPVLLRRFFGQG